MINSTRVKFIIYVHATILSQILILILSMRIQFVALCACAYRHDTQNNHLDCIKPDQLSPQLTFE